MERLSNRKLKIFRNIIHCRMHTRIGESTPLVVSTNVTFYHFLLDSGLENFAFSANAYSGWNSIWATSYFQMLKSLESSDCVSPLIKNFLSQWTLPKAILFFISLISKGPITHLK